MEKRFNAWTNYLLTGIACLHIILFFIPIKIEPEKFSKVESSGRGETYFVISPNGTLVGWGGNDYRLVANGHLLFYPYFARKTILRNVVDVDIGWRSAMAVDKNGTLWGWGSLPLEPLEKQPVLNRPVKIMEDIAEVELEISYTALVKTDRSLWIWGENLRKSRTPESRKVMQDVKSIYSFGENIFAIQDNNDLYAFAYSAGGMVRYPTHIATGIKAVSGGYQNKYQLLTMDGKVLLYSDDGYENKVFKAMDTHHIPIADNVRTLCPGGLIKNDDSYWLWQESKSGEMSLIKQQENVAHAIGSVIIITRDGKMYAEAIMDKCPTIPQSMRTVSPILRNLFSLVFLTKLIMNKYFKKNCCLYDSIN